MKAAADLLFRPTYCEIVFLCYDYKHCDGEIVILYVWYLTFSESLLVEIDE